MKSIRLKLIFPRLAFNALMLGSVITIASAFGAAPAAAVTMGPCALLTRAEAKQVLGAPIQSVTTGKAGLISTGRECKYLTPMSTQGGSIELYVYDDATVRSDKDSLFKSAADYFQRNMHALRASGSKLVAIPSLGNSAYWDSGADLLHVLDRGIYIKIWVDPHLRMIHISARSSEELNKKVDAVKREAAVKIARDILPRLAHFSST